jgi:hypothetical protein
MGFRRGEIVSHSERQTRVNFYVLIMNMRLYDIHVLIMNMTLYDIHVLIMNMTLYDIHVLCRVHSSVM